MDYKLLVPVFAVWVTVRWNDANPNPMAFNGNMDRSIDRIVKPSGRIHSLTEHQRSLKNLEINSRELEFEESCGMATTDKCQGIFPPEGSGNHFNHTLLEQIKRIDNAADCQWFCSEYYAGNCTWWMYDETTRYCKIFNEPQEDLYDDCFELGFSSYPSLSECVSLVDPLTNTNCDYFRQDYCRYEKDFLDNLEHSHNIETCQRACQINPSCNFFTFSKDEDVCILHQVDVKNRVCDIIHGPPSPTLQSCLDDGLVPWAQSSRLASLMPTVSTTTSTMPTTEATGSTTTSTMPTTPTTTSSSPTTTSTTPTTTSTSPTTTSASPTTTTA